MALWLLIWFDLPSTDLLLKCIRTSAVREVDFYRTSLRCTALQDPLSACVLNDDTLSAAGNRCLLIYARCSQIFSTFTVLFTQCWQRYAKMMDKYPHGTIQFPLIRAKTERSVVLFVDVSNEVHLTSKTICKIECANRSIEPEKWCKCNAAVVVVVVPRCWRKEGVESTVGTLVVTSEKWCVDS